MIHIVFEEANIEALKKSFELDPSMEGEILLINDDFAVGPINDLFTQEGIVSRKDWWKTVLNDGPYQHLLEDDSKDDNKTVTLLKERLVSQPEEVIWIWAAQNKHDVCSYYWLMCQLKDLQGSVFILYLNNLPFINEKGNIFYPTNLFQIQPKEFIKAKKLARPITLSEFEIDPDEWHKIMNENKGVRLLEGGKKLAQKEIAYYDAELIKFISNDWIKLNKLFSQYYGKIKETTGDAFLFWRLKQLSVQGEINMQGNLKNLKDIEIRLAGVATNEAIIEVEQSA